MSSGFYGGGSDFYTVGGRPITNNLNPKQQVNYRSTLAGILPDPASQIMPSRRPDLIGKRSLADFQQQSFLQQQQIHNQNGLGFYLRNVKSRPNYQHASPVSPLSLVDFSPVSSISTEVGAISNPPGNPRYGVPILHQPRPQNMNNVPVGSSFPNLVQNGAGSGVNSGTVSGQECFSTQESEKKLMNHRLQELEKQLLCDEDEGEAVSIVTNSEWSDTIQNLINPTQKTIAPSPTSSSSSCASTSASPPLPCPKQSMIDASIAISEGKNEIALEILTRLRQVSNTIGTSEQRLTAYLASALKSRANHFNNPSALTELYSKEHIVTTQMLYDVSPCFKLGFMAANLAILEATSDHLFNKLHVVDFNIGKGGQYVHLLHAFAAKNGGKKLAVLKITTFTDFMSGGEEKLKIVGEGLKVLASKIGVCFSFCIMNSNIRELTREKLAVDSDEVLAVNFAFELYKLPDESVTTENLRDDLLRRVKGLSPNVVTVVEQEMNANTAPLVARVKEACEYYGALFDSLDATVSRDNSDRVRIEEGLGRKMCNSVACEGRDRVDRCEVFGKWRARLSMAGFQSRPVSPLDANSLLSRLNSGMCSNPGFTVNELCGRICFGWMGRTLTVASAWR
ncbi:scarecrow-like protein 8 isoform X2 [Olea europaea var. sylvestris]|uniref:scarecrow-like protein 8 isoform X1 n=1 Tax=Olea europaea var. sylvestris TaxID=158386 RepID=UPI000C1D6368|nr:scarecrow-like protein 8 isoform X1 [Olea europaea var. sylvestris]XP_022874491.1 scarecrow-like protein 8 isoform X2 [Olea europaea var. sylvestris]